MTTPYQPAPYSGQNWQPALRRPPLVPRAKRGALWAGIAGFNLLSIGFSVFVIPLALATFAAFFAFIVGRMSMNDRDFLELHQFTHAFDIGAWIIPILIVSLLGLAIMVAAVFVSRGILRAHADSHPLGVTFAGAGIAIVAFWLLSWIGGAFSQLAIGALSAGRQDVGAVIAAGVVIYAIVAIVLNSVIGWLSWWWMAHAMRPRA